MSRQRKARSAQAAPSHDRWLLSYVDFVTLLLAVFIVLFATTWHHKQTLKAVSGGIHSGFEALGVGAHQSSAVAEPAIPKVVPTAAQQTQGSGFVTSELTSQLKGVLGDSIQKQEIVMQQTPDGLIISLRELGFFNSGEASLLPGAAGKLKQTAQILMQHGMEIRVEGHSDDQPIHTAAFRSNWELSTARAMSVLSLLLDEASFPPTRISVAGYGPYRPVADNSTPAGRRSNRRVDLVILAPRSSEQKLP